MLLRHLWFGILFAAPAVAQFDRYELGLRLRDCERRLAAATDAKQRSAALAELDRAVQSFFRLDAVGVARAVAAASACLAPPASAAQQFAASLQLRLARRLADPSAPLPFEVLPVWPAELPAGPPLRLVVQVADDPLVRAEVALDSIPAQGTLALAGLPAGDHEITWSVRQGDAVLQSRRQGLSIATDLAARLTQVTASAGSRDRTPGSIEAGTLDLLAGMLGGMTRERGEETVLPGARLLADAESLARPPAADAPPFYGPARTGQHWLRLPVGRGTVVARVLVPPAPETPAAQARLPLVLALHGMGGSENLFFDGYGDGAIVAACAQRGWFLAAPRLGASGIDLPGTIDALASRWPIDRRRVAVIGHSMGAGQAMASVARNPECFAAVAALGGGGSVPRGEAAKAVRFFVGVGERDFARQGAIRLHTGLQRAGLTSSLHEYPAVEHLAIVQFALPDVFQDFAGAFAAR